MHLAVAFLAVTLAGPAPDPAPLGETLEILATGTVTRPADIVTFSIAVEESGSSEAEARRMAEERVRNITGAARAAGVADADIRASRIYVTRFSGMAPGIVEAFREQAELRRSVRESDRGDDGRIGEQPPINATANAGIVLRLRDLSRLDALRHAVSTAAGSELDWPDYALADQREADAAARRQALAMARAEAEAQAASRGLRVARIARVSERVGAQLAEEMLRDFFVHRRSSAQSLPGPDITVRRPVAVTFELAPR